MSKATRTDAQSPYTRTTMDVSELGDHHRGLRLPTDKLALLIAWSSSQPVQSP